MATYVDNLFAVSTCPENAIAMLQMMEDRLGYLWGLHIKPDSREYMLVHGGDEPVSISAGWSKTRYFGALGHVLEPDGGTEECWRRTKASMWKAFFANAGCRRASSCTGLSSPPWTIGVRGGQLLSGG